MPHHDAVRRRWFSDARDQGRQMEVSWHPEQHIVIVSIWSATRCRASFRLPIEEAPGVIEMLAASLGDAATERGRRRGRDPMAAILERLRTGRRQADATIIGIDERPTP
jgi:hypothetical protein